MTMRSTKKPRLADADADAREIETRYDALDLTADLLRQTTAFSWRLLNMLQQHSDIDPFALLGDPNFAPAHLRDELLRKRNNALKLHMIPGDCSNAVLEFLHVPEACVLQRTCRGFLTMVKRSLRRTRAVAYRGERIDGHVLNWLVHVYRACPKLKLAKRCCHWDTVSDLWREAFKEGAQIDSKAVGALLDVTDVDPNYSRGDLIKTALWHALHGNNVELVRRLLTCPDIDVNSRFNREIRKFNSSRGDSVQSPTPLMVAAILGHKDVVSLLLADPRCDVNLRAVRIENAFRNESYEETVLHVSTDSGVLEALLASPRVDPNMRSAKGRTAFFHAIFSFNKEAARVLVACDRVDVNADALIGTTPLHILCSRCFEDTWKEICDLLLRRKDINKNAIDDSRKSALMVAALYGNVYMIRGLLADEKVVVDCVDNDGYTALHHAVSPFAYNKPMAMCINALRNSGRFGSKVNLRNKHSKAALHVLLSEKHRPREALEALLKFPDIDVNAHLDINDYLDTPLHLAVRKDCPDYVQLLLGVPGIDLSRQNSKKNTPLDLAFELACSRGDKEEFCSRVRVFELLLDAPAPDCDLYARNARMLRYAASDALYFERTTALEMLLRTPRPGIDTRAKSSSSRGRGSRSKRETALEYALRKNPSCSDKTRRKVVSIFNKARRKGI